MKLLKKDGAFLLMNGHVFSLLIGAFFFLLSSCASTRVISQPSLEDLVRESTFIFKGTVLKLKSATMPGVSISEKTVVVRVDEILQTPTLLGKHIVGKQITVELKDHGTLEVGKQTIFFARGWLLGEGTAVQELGRLPIEKWSDLRNEIIEMRQTIVNQQLQRRIESANIIVVGKVLQIKIADQQGEARPLTEHDPAWEEATIQVESVLKGDVVQKNVVYRFSGSIDIAWINAPKFKVGQEGIWILQKDPKTTAYTVIDPLDFQPKNQAGKVKALISSTK